MQNKYLVLQQFCDFELLWICIKSRHFRLWVFQRLAFLYEFVWRTRFEDIQKSEKFSNDNEKFFNLELLLLKYYSFPISNIIAIKIKKSPKILIKMCSNSRIEIWIWNVYEICAKICYFSSNLMRLWGHILTPSKIDNKEI